MPLDARRYASDATDMLSYQHSYHAANPADIHKHVALSSLIGALTRKPRAITYLETHAGRGLYDLDGEEATKTGEWKAGLARLDAATTGAEAFRRALDAARDAHGPDAYPGSPWIARQLLRPDDRLILMEKHPAEAKALRKVLASSDPGRPNVAVHHRDGPEGALALSPPAPRRGLVLVDPSYEVKDEYESIGAFALALHRKWPEAVICVWYPVLAAGRHRALVEALAPLEPMHDRVGFAPHGGRESAMRGSGLLIVNAPYGLEVLPPDLRAAFDPPPH